MMVVLYFSCNSDVAVGGFKYCIYLNHYLAWTSHTHVFIDH